MTEYQIQGNANTLHSTAVVVAFQLHCRIIRRDSESRQVSCLPVTTTCRYPIDSSTAWNCQNNGAVKITCPDRYAKYLPGQAIEDIHTRLNPHSIRTEC
jgi:hypothetical protein